MKVCRKKFEIFLRKSISKNVAEIHLEILKIIRVENVAEIRLKFFAEIRLENFAKICLENLAEIRLEKFADKSLKFLQKSFWKILRKSI